MNKNLEEPLDILAELGFGEGAKAEELPGGLLLTRLLTVLFLNLQVSQALFFHAVSRGKQMDEKSISNISSCFAEVRGVPVEDLKLMRFLSVERLQEMGRQAVKVAGDQAEERAALVAGIVRLRWIAEWLLVSGIQAGTVSREVANLIVGALPPLGDEGGKIDPETYKVLGRLTVAELCGGKRFELFDLGGWNPGIIPN